MRKPGQTGGTSSVFRLRGVVGKRLRIWIKLRTSTINRFLSRTSNRLLQRRIGKTWQTSTCSSMVTWFLSWKGALKALRLCATPRPKGLDAWRRLNHKYGPRNPLRNIQLLEKLLAPSQVGSSDVVASMESLEQELRVVRQRFDDDWQNLWESIHMVCIQKICPKIRRDHLAVQAASFDFSEKQRLRIEKFLQANVHGSGATSMDVHDLL